MLVEFRVSNYRSIYKRQLLSMVATKDEIHIETNCSSTNISGIPYLVNSAVLYGPNASGKSNLIYAIEFMRNMVTTSAVGITEGQLLNSPTFRFEPEASEHPSEFEIIFIENDIRYQYGFALNTNRILKEWLLVYVAQKAQRWFEREYNPEKGKDNWSFGSHLSGGKQRNIWSESTRSNALFLSTAVNLNSDQLRSVYNWFLNKLVILSNHYQQPAIYTMKCIEEDINKQTIIELLQAADLGIKNIEIKKEKGLQHQFRLDMEGKIAVENQPTDIRSPIFFYQGKNQKIVPFNFNEESHGTQRLFAYAGPIIDILQTGKILIIDELDNSMHPQMMQFLIKLIQNNNINRNKAQLFFTTHNTSLLDTELFRRDQIWFMEKDRENASHLYPLTDFSPRKSEALEKGYLHGRYGALPFFGEFNL